MYTQTRRQFLKTAGAGAAALALPTFWRTTGAKPALQLGLWNHWVPGANPMSQKIIEGWGAKNNVEVKIDFIGSGDALPKAAAIARAGVGPDIFAFILFDSGLHADKLIPCNDLMDRLQKKYGETTAVAKYTLLHDGKWIGVPISIGSHTDVMQTRISLFKEHCGLDVTELFPTDEAKRDQARVRKEWTYTNFLAMAKKLHAADVPFGGAISECNDSCNWLHPLFAAHGSLAMDEKGEITLESDATLAALEYVVELSQYIPKGVYGWDDASNNRHIISGKGGAIFNPPSSWAVAVKDARPIGADIWHHDVPFGPKGAFRGAKQYNWCVWQHCKEPKAAMDLMEYMFEPENTYALIEASRGYDQPAFPKLYGAPTYANAAPPKGTLYNYTPRGEETMMAVGMPAPAVFAVKMWTKRFLPVMCAKAASGELKPKDAVKWAVGQLEDYKAEG